MAKPKKSKSKDRAPVTEGNPTTPESELAADSAAAASPITSEPKPEPPAKPPRKPRNGPQNPKAGPPPAQDAGIQLQVFLKICGKKPDQTAGFAHYARNAKLGPLTVPDWRKEYQKFMDRPVR